MKLVWICHFTNEEIQKILPLWKKKPEFSSWISNMLKGFENREDIEIHVISPHEYLKRYTTITIRNIHYHFIPFGIPFWHRHWPNFFRFDIYTDFCFFNRQVKNVIKKIQPDMINLHGAENAYYSSVILDLYKTYPVLILIQGIISEYKNDKSLSIEIKKRISVEEKIFTKLKYFCGDSDASTYISYYNKNHIFFKLEYPVNEELITSIKDSVKKYDCIFFGRLTKDKGIVDFIKVISELKKSIPDIRACIVGGGNIQPFEKFSRDLGCFENIKFMGFVKSQSKLFELVKASKIFLAPSLVDRLPSTIREAMFLKIPIVAYATGAIPSVNTTRENILLVKKGDFAAMAKKTYMLLENSELREALADKAFEFYKNEFSLEVNLHLFLSAYKTILSNEKLT